MERIVDFIMTHLFQLAEYVCGKCLFLVDEPANPLINLSPRVL